MKLKITARHFTARQVLREEAKSAAEKIGKFNDRIVSCEIIFSNEKTTEPIHSAEIIVHVDHTTLVVKEEGSDFSKSLHEATEKMIRQLRKVKTKAETSTVRAKTTTARAKRALVAVEDESDDDE
jgi:putative sigma-54 modulation protein